MPFKTSLIFTCLFITLSMLSSCTRPAGVVKEAQKAEVTGDYQSALDNYATAAIKTSATIPFPNARQSSVTRAPSEWLEEINSYVENSFKPVKRFPQLTPEIIDGLKRVMDKTEGQNYPLRTNRSRLTPTRFSELWSDIFPVQGQYRTEWNTLLEHARRQDFTFLKLRSRKNYTYHFSILNTETNRRINLTLFPESEKYLPLAPGPYIVLVKSTVTFSNGQQWRSSYSAFPLSLNAETMTSVVMRTRVNRN
ncbi:hypothetical protein QA601_16785 [Chitinispirillales bacterium ANBcel5]|uniref:hypothetical protein n=1 Tax=Cellulosispirillum alkaliphilum TaxID=3039283 RepID=UPI002A520F95|nr:hypothetical protein [Chitinispirillales bacterium ANBcel5]